MAAINSLLGVPVGAVRGLNGKHVLMSRAHGRRVALVGHFPFVPELGTVAEKLWVLELRPEPGDYPADAAPELLPQADVVAITGSMIVKGTLDGLLALARPDAFVILMGPSSPLSPVLFVHGVYVVAGAVIGDESLTIPALIRGVVQAAARPGDAGARTAGGRSLRRKVTLQAMRPGAGTDLSEIRAFQPLEQPRVPGRVDAGFDDLDLGVHPPRIVLCRPRG